MPPWHGEPNFGSNRMWAFCRIIKACKFFGVDPVSATALIPVWDLSFLPTSSLVSCSDFLARNDTRRVGNCTNYARPLRPGIFGLKGARARGDGG